MKKIFTFIVGILIAINLIGCSKKEENKIESGIIRIAYNQATTHPHYQALYKAGEKFSEMTDGRFKFLIYPNEVLGDQRATLELVQNGALQMAIVNNAMLENYNKDFGILGLPYIFNSQEHQKKIFTSGVLDELFESTKQYKFEVMAAYTAGSRNIYTKKPIKNPKDLDGMKIRVMESPVMVATLKYMGGVGTPMSQGEVYTAIQQGVLDGGENNEITYMDMKHYEVAPYFSQTQHIMVPDVVIAESKYLEKMSKEDRELLRKLLDESIEEEFKLWNEQIEIAKENAVKQGVTFVDVDIKPFQKNCEILHKEFMKDSKFAQKLYEKIRKIGEE